MPSWEQVTGVITDASISQVVRVNLRPPNQAFEVHRMLFQAGELGGVMYLRRNLEATALADINEVMRVPDLLVSQLVSNTVPSPLMHFDGGLVLAGAVQLGVETTAGAFRVDMWGRYVTLTAIKWALEARRTFTEGG